MEHIKNLHCENNLWKWSHFNNEYHTNEKGEGLWVNGKQVAGTCQFSLYGMSISGARRKLNRIFENVPAEDVNHRYFT